MSRAWDVVNRLFWDIHSATWDAGELDPDRAAAVAEWLDALGVPRGATVLDAGCATGEITFALDRAGFKAAGLDLSPAMLRRARRKAAAGGRAVAFQLGSLNERLPFADGSFQVVVCVHAIQCVRDLPGLWRELRRVLVPGGKLAVEAKAPGSPGRGLAASSPMTRLGWSTKRLASRAVAHVPGETLAAQLEACGYEDIQLAADARALRLSARSPRRS